MTTCDGSIASSRVEPRSRMSPAATSLRHAPRSGRPPRDVCGTTTQAPKRPSALLVTHRHKCGRSETSSERRPPICDSALTLARSVSLEAARPPKGCHPPLELCATLSRCNPRRGTRRAAMSRSRTRSSATDPSTSSSSMASSVISRCRQRIQVTRPSSSGWPRSAA